MSKDLQTTTATAALMGSFKEELKKVTPYLKTLLGHDELVQRFIQMTHLALMRDPKLLQANMKSLLMALIWAAYRDLEPGVEDGVWLIPYKGIVTPVPAYKGLIKRSVDTKSVVSVKARPIYQGDTVKVTYGLHEDLVHEPSFGEQRGSLIGAAVVFELPDGRQYFHVMFRPEIEKIRNSSAAWKASPNSGPWEQWEEQMFLKTVIKQGFRTIPVKSQVRDLIADDNRLEAGATIESLLNETGQELPDDLGGGEAADPNAGKREEVIDTSGFDKLVEAKFATIKEAEEYKRQYQLLQAFLEETANGQKKKLTVPELKKLASSRDDYFASFWSKFEEYAAKQAPPPAQAQETTASPEAAASPGPETTAAPEETKPATPQDTTTPPWGEGGGEQTQDFLKRQEAVWNQVVEKMIPLEILKEVDIHDHESITPENIDQIEELVNGYEPPKKGKK